MGLDRLEEERTDAPVVEDAADVGGLKEAVGRRQLQHHLS